MNIKNAVDYTIGLDLGTGSVGWAVVSNEGSLYTRYGKPTMGSRLFSNAETAAATRLKRGQRRRYDRRRQRIERLQELFATAMSEVDPSFFVRMRESALCSQDRSDAFGTDARHALFNTTDFTEADYYGRFPTIWHLRKYLMESSEKADLRLIYLALHNIVKYRGNFLREDESGITASNANAEAAVSTLMNAMLDYLDVHGEEELSFDPDGEELRRILDAKGRSRANRIEAFEKALRLSDSKRAKLIARACMGYKVEFANLFFGLEKTESTGLSIQDDERVEAFLAVCPDDARPVFEALQALYSSFVLSSTLGGAPSLSDAMVASYERHAEDLAIVKALVKEYLGIEAYRKMFRGPKTAAGDYDINKLPKGSYTAYIAGEKLANGKGCTHEDFLKNLRKVLASSDDLVRDERYRSIRDRLEADDSDFLAKQKTRANGAIPFQLHLEEMSAIIERQGAFYPFLNECRDDLLKLVRSRIPYYVGPLNAGHDPMGNYPSNAVDHSRKFAWSVRRQGMEGARAYPWNYEEVIDVDKTAELFIRRMTGTCTYVYGEPVLPRCSLLYEEFCVLNELNSAKWCEAGKTPHRFDWADREEMVEDLFKARKTVTHKLVADWLRMREEVIDPVISGTQGETGFESKLSSYNDFCKILHVRRLEDDNCPLRIWDIEQIILWNTVFEDRSILRRKLEQAYGDILDAEQIKKIVRKRCTGWGRLSEKLLLGIKADTPMGPMSIMDILRHGDPTTGHHRQAMNLMETLREKTFGFEQTIDGINRERLEQGAFSLDDMPGSPALRRSVNQALRVIDDIVSLTGTAPARICIEVTRDDDVAKKGRRTATRYQKLSDALGKLKADALEFDKGVVADLKASKDKLDNEKLVLYFMQNGKSLYSGVALDINQLHTYEVDHIIPQCYVKDDSFDNKALVRKEENQRKLDSLLLDPKIIHTQRAWWTALNRAGLISDKKLKNLTCTDITERMIKGFINRQLVETSQIVKFVRQLCEQRYPGTKVISVKASLGHELRERCGLTKCREFNNYHHAHDAYIACEMARFIEYRYPKWQDGFDLAMVRRYVKSLGGDFATTRRMPGRSGFIVDSFLRDGFDRDTGEIFKDQWDAGAVVGRMRRVMGYKEIFITRMVEEQTGALWDETVYSPKDSSKGKNLAMPLKGFGTGRALNPKKYGGFSKVKQAYFFAFRARDKKGNWKYFFEGVPIHLVDTVGRSKEALTAYANQIASENTCHDAQVLRAKIPLRQKFELDGSVFYLFGRSNKKNEIRSARELAGSVELTACVKAAIALAEDFGQEDRVALFEQLVGMLERCCPRLAASLSLRDHVGDIATLADAEFSKLIAQIVRGSKTDLQGCDLSMLGRSPSSGFMLVNLASNLGAITWIDESVTGMYVRRTTYEDIVHGL